MTEALIVSVEINGRTVDAGTAHIAVRRSSVSTSFQYDRSYLARHDAYSLDPGLPLFDGQHHVGGLPGAFTDCAPDRWGRNLIGKRIRAQAVRDGRTIPMVTEADYLTGVSDLTRQGALRFRSADGGPYLDPDDDVPKLVELPALVRAADLVAADGDDDLQAIKVLLAAGTGTLGGARPKASIRDSNRLYIAKFPHHTDQWDVMSWEKTALDLAEQAGIETPARALHSVDGRSVLLLERFDREDGRRIGYLSAMTLVQARDGDEQDYVYLAEALPEFATATGRTLGELWRRIAFCVAIHNTDDHFRNHGFLRDGNGWRLSPIFDVNPNPDIAAPRSTAIGGAVTRRDELEGLLANADTFGLDRHSARQVLGDVFAATENWRQVADRNGISAAECRRFEPVFEGLREDVVHAIRHG